MRPKIAHAYRGVVRSAWPGGTPTTNSGSAPAVRVVRKLLRSSAGLALRTQCKKSGLSCRNKMMYRPDVKVLVRRSDGRSAGAPATLVCSLQFSFA